MSPNPTAVPDVVLPWFHRWPRLATTTTAVLFGAVVLVRLWLPEEEAVTALFVFPISLVAMAHGLRAGLAAGVVALVLVGLGLVVTDASLSTTGWVIRVVTLLAVGALLGRTADDLVRAERTRRMHERAAQLQQHAVEINDTLVQGMSAAKWALEDGRTESGLGTLTDTIALGQNLVSELIREGDQARHLVARN